MRRAVWICMLWWLALPTKAQEKMFTLEDCIAYALEHRTEVAASLYSGQDAEREVRYTRLQQLPDLNASASHSLNWGRSLNMEKYEWEDSKNQYGNVSLSSSLTLFSGFQLRNQIKASKLNVLLQKTSHRKLRDDIRLEVVQAFYEVLAAEEQLLLANVFYEEDVQQERKARLQDSLRRISLPDLLEISGQTQKALLEKKAAEKQLQLAWLNLKKCMNYQETERVKLQREEMCMAVPDVDRIYEAALAQLPELQMLRLDSLLLRNELKQLRGNFSPTLSVSGLWYSRYQNNLSAPMSGRKYTWWDQLQDNNYKQVGISLSIPLFNRQTVRRQIHLLKTEMETQRLNWSQTATSIRWEIEQLCIEASNLKDNLLILEKQEENCRKVYELRQVQFQQGKLSVYDLLAAEASWKDSRINLEMEHYNLCCYLVMLRIYAGE